MRATYYVDVITVVSTANKASGADLKQGIIRYWFVNYEKARTFHTNAHAASNGGEHFQLGTLTVSTASQGLDLPSPLGELLDEEVELRLDEEPRSAGEAIYGGNVDRS